MQKDNAIVINGDSLEILKTLESDSVDSLVTDPPAGISFMGKSWDDDKGGRDEWIAWLSSVMREALRVLKPGAHGLVWAIPRTSHWTGMALEDAGFEVRDCITHLFGSGFPKSLDISKAIDKAAGAERIQFQINHFEDTRAVKNTGNAGIGCAICGCTVVVSTGLKCGHPKDSGPATAAAKQWQGWGTALKPSCEFWFLIRKPLSEKTVAANVLKHGCGGLNIDGCRIEAGSDHAQNCARTFKSGIWAKSGEAAKEISTQAHGSGRFPANLVLSCSDTCTEDAHDMFDCPIAMLDAQSGTLVSKWGKQKSKHVGDKSSFGLSVPDDVNKFSGDTGGASRFFYCAKASRSDKNAGLEGMPDQRGGCLEGNIDHTNSRKIGARPDKPTADVKNNHPTVKSTKLMSYLIKLVTPPNGVVLDPFTGSGSTGVVAIKEGFRFIGIEREPEYVKIAKKRIEAASGLF